MWQAANRLIFGGLQTKSPAMPFYGGIDKISAYQYNNIDTVRGKKPSIIRSGQL